MAPRTRARRLTPALAVLMAATATAQDPPTTTKPAPAASTGASSTNVIVAVQTAPDISIAELRETVRTAIQVLAAKKKIDEAQVVGKTSVDPITAEQYRAYRLLMDDLAAPGDQSAVPGKPGDQLTFSPLGGDPPTWRVQVLGEGRRSLEKLTVTYRPAAPKEGAAEPKELTKEFTPSLDPKAELALVQPGVYTLRLPAGAVPLKYTGNLWAEKKDGEAAGDFPRGDNYYLIRLPNFQTSLDDLRSTLQSKEALLGNAMILNDDRDMRLMVGRIRPTGTGTDEDYLEKNKLILFEPALTDPQIKSKTRRAWVLFPLDEGRVKTYLGKLNSSTPQGVLELIKKSGSDPDIGLPPHEAAGGADMILSAATKPRWIELTPAVGANAIPGSTTQGFARTIYLINKDANTVKPGDYANLLKSFPRPYKIVVYELDNMKPGAERVVTAVRYSPPRNPNSPEQLAHSAELTLWGTQLGRLSANPAPPPKDGK